MQSDEVKEVLRLIPPRPKTPVGLAIQNASVDDAYEEQVSAPVTKPAPVVHVAAKPKAPKKEVVEEAEGFAKLESELDSLFGDD